MSYFVTIGNWNCGVIGCTRCRNGQYHYCKYCGVCPSNHYSSNCLMNPKNRNNTLRKHNVLNNSNLGYRSGSASFVVPVQYNFRGTGRNALLLILEINKGCATWIGGKIDPGETSVGALYRETSEEYGNKLTDKVRKSIGMNTRPHLVQKGSNMYVVSINSFSRNKTYRPTQYPSETMGAIWVFVDSLQGKRMYRNYRGTSVISVHDTDGKIYEVSSFVQEVSSKLVSAGYI